MRPRGRASGSTTLKLYGWHAVRAALFNPARRVRELWAAQTALAAVEAVVAEAGAARPSGDAAPSRLPKPRVMEADAIAKRLGAQAVHQGVAAVVEPLAEPDFGDLLDRIAQTQMETQVARVGGGAQQRDARPGPNHVMVLDHVTDPHNVGAILRSCSVFGIGDLVMTLRYAPPLSGALAKAACGGLEHVRVHQVVNLGDALQEMGDAGAHIIGLDERGPADISRAARDAGGRSVVLAMGAEDRGLRQRTRDLCHTLARIESHGPLQALNVSNAAAISLYAVANASVSMTTGVARSPGEDGAAE